MHPTWPCVYRFDTRTDQQRERRTAAALGIAPESPEAFECVHCAFIITYRAAEISMAGKHAHWLTNPDGYTFHVGCFDSAPGCGDYGTVTEQHSWFPGYAWSHALCNGCGTHLGWRFRSRVDEFYGLILDRLVLGACPRID
ncbi:MAG: cereblon family protein [Methylococcales bacterium]